MTNSIKIFEALCTLLHSGYSTLKSYRFVRCEVTRTSDGECDYVIIVKMKNEMVEEIWGDDEGRERFLTGNIIRYEQFPEFFNVEDEGT